MSRNNNVLPSRVLTISPVRRGTAIGCSGASRGGGRPPTVWKRTESARRIEVDEFFMQSPCRPGLEQTI
jgi:hypothetical protein